MKPSNELPCAPAAYVAVHQQIVYTFCHRALGQEAVAQEVAQRSFEYAWPPVHPWDARAESLRLLAVAYREVIWWSSRSRPVYRLAAGDHVGAQVLLASLPIENRCAVVLRCCCGLTLEEVGAVAGLPRPQVRARVIDACRELVPWLRSVHDMIPVLSAQVASGCLPDTPMLQEEVSNVTD